MEKTWEVSFDKSKRTWIEDQIRDNFEKLPGRTRHYFYKEDLSMIIEKMDELIKNMTTQNNSVTEEYKDGELVE